MIFFVRGVQGEVWGKHHSPHAYTHVYTQRQLDFWT
jgi:hypothetical protein